MDLRYQKKRYKKIYGRGQAEEEAFINGKISPVNLSLYKDHKESIKALNS